MTTRRMAAVGLGLVAVAAVAVPLIMSDPGSGGGGVENGTPATEQREETDARPATTAPIAASTTSQPATASEPATTISPATTSPIATSQPPAPCALASAGIDQVIVFGNSTDHTFPPEDPIDMVAWPERVAQAGDPELFRGVAVVNESQRGQTMGDYDAWGPGRELRLGTHLDDVLDRLTDIDQASTVAVVAPSYIDLQLNDYDADRALADLLVHVATMSAAGLDTLVLPMNYVSTSLDDRLPRLNPTVAEFNELLADRHPDLSPLAESPLRHPERLGGDDSLYDDFPGHDVAGRFIGADGFHPDGDGHDVKAAVVHGLLVDQVAALVPGAAC